MRGGFCFCLSFFKTKPRGAQEVAQLLIGDMTIVVVVDLGEALSELGLVLGHLLPQLDCFSKGAGEAQGLGGG